MGNTYCGPSLTWWEPVGEHSTHSRRVFNGGFWVRQMCTLRSDRGEGGNMNMVDTGKSRKKMK